MKDKEGERDCPWNIILRIETTDWPFGFLMFYIFFFLGGCMCRVDDLLFEYMMILRRVILRPRAKLVETLQLSLFMLSLVANAGT